MYVLMRIVAMAVCVTGGMLIELRVYLEGPWSKVMYSIPLKSYYDPTVAHHEKVPYVVRLRYVESMVYLDPYYAGLPYSGYPEGFG